MRKTNANGLIIILATAFFFIIMMYETKNPVLYLTTLIVISISILVTEKNYIVNASNLFVAYYIYVLAFGPVILLYEKLYLNFDYFIYILGGLLSFSWGSYLYGIKKNSLKRRRIKRYNFNLDRVTIIRVLWVVSVIAGLIYAYKNRNYLFVGDIQNGRVAAMAGNGALIQLSQLPTALIPMLYQVYFESRYIYHKKKSSLLEIIIMSVVSFMIIIMQGYRSYAITFILCLAIIYIYKNKIKNTKIIAIGITGIILLEILGLIRSLMSSSTVPAALSFAYSLRNSLIVNSNNLGHVIATFPSRTPFQLGKTYFMNFGLLLPGAGTDFTMWLKNQVGIAFAGGGRTSSILGEAYLNYGTWFVFVGMFMMGMFGRALTNYAKEHDYSFLSVYLMWQFAHSASGGIANVILPVSIYIVVYIFISMFPICITSKGLYTNSAGLTEKREWLNG
ncbi:O-antigen polymerase [Enterocloster citroniae]